MTTITCVLWLTRPRKLWHVVPVEFIKDGEIEVQLVHGTTLCGTKVRGEPEDLDIYLADCPRCASRAALLIEQS